MEKAERSLTDGNFDADWLNPPAIFRPAPFWSLNSKLEIPRLCSQIESMNNVGMGGFFMHSRYGLKTEYLSDEWFECLRACVETARRLGLKAYLYDEDRYPSGSNGGMITRDNVEYRTHFLNVTITDHIESPDHAHLGMFNILLDEQGCLRSYQQVTELSRGEFAVSGHQRKLIIFDVKTEHPRAWENDGTYLDTMNPDAVREFIRITHQEYKKRLKDDFGTLIPAIFTDEPNAGYESVGRKEKELHCHWSLHFREEFRNRRGYDLVPLLPELVFGKSGQHFSKVRYDYFKTVSELLVESYTKQIGDWCAENSLRLTGHVLWEEPLNAQISAVGSCMPHYEYMQWPGIDMLCDQSKELATVKQCTSVADQLGKERVLSELYGCTGWDWPLEGHKFIADWQFALGVNFLCTHLSHYSLAGGAKRDCPASIRDHSPWWPYFKTVQDYLSRLSFMLTQGRPMRDVLVIHPIESSWGVYNFDRIPFIDDLAEEIPASLKMLIWGLTENHYDWDFGDETLLAKHGSVQANQLVICNMQYKVVVIPPAVTLRSETIVLLEQFAESGGVIMCISPFPTLVDGTPCTRFESLLTKSHCFDDSLAAVASMENILPRRLSIRTDNVEAKQVWAMLRQGHDWQMVFMQSHDRQGPIEVSITVKDAQEPVIVWDAITGKKSRITSDITNDGLVFSYKLDSSGSALFTFGVEVPDAQCMYGVGEITATNSFEGPFKVQLTEPNSFPLDYCKYKLGTGEYSELLPTLKVDEMIRKKFGLEARLGIEQQPYYLSVNGIIDTQHRGVGQLVFSFHVTEIPRTCELVIENPQDFQININGHSVNVVNGFWIDEDFKTIKIQPFIRKSLNEICLEFNYRTDMEIEDLYLIGDFGVNRINSAKTPAPNNMTIVNAVSELKLGSWIGQGLDFYSGAVKYNIPLKSPIKQGSRAFIRLKELSCTAAVIHVGQKRFVLPWAPFVAEITEAITPAISEITIELIGGRKNILGPLHVPWQKWTVPECFSPNNSKWNFEYQLNHHGLNAAVIIEWRN